MNPKNIRTILFDYDGTLHDALHIYAPAFRKAYEYLVKNGHVEERSWSDDEISKFLGQTPKEMWDAFGKGLPESVKREASSIIGSEMERLTNEGQTRLYEGTIETLRELKRRDYLLVFISNCRNYYMHAHTQLFSLGRYFDHMVCSESYPGIEAKEKVLETLKPELVEEMVIIGDRHHDMTAGKHNNIHTIGARYGFGDDEELSDADRTIDDIREVLDIFKGVR